MKASFLLFLIILVALTPLSQPSWSQTKSSAKPVQVASVERKLEHLESNGALATPDPAPTDFSEQEINAYLASGRIELPAGVQSVVLQEQPQVVVGTSRVDFDKLKSGKNSYNPLLTLKGRMDKAWFTSIRYPSMALMFPRSCWISSWRNTSSLGIRTLASTRDLLCRRGLMRRL
jgi:hypothetical protein